MDIQTVDKFIKKIDMMVTAYSVLRDRYKRYSFCIDIIQLGISVILCVTVFIDPKILQLLTISPEFIKLTLGICSVLLFFLALITLRANWNDCSNKCEHVAEALGKLKIDIINLKEMGLEINHEKIAEKFNDYSWITNNVYKIPEKQFLKLKSKHLRKVELSILLSRNPGSYLFTLRLELFIKNLKKSFFNQTDIKNEDINAGKQEACSNEC